jgi:Arc/MetJ-type ribon-helix-helix transcriptional regulator
MEASETCPRISYLYIFAIKMICGEAMNILVRLEGVPEKALEFMISKGFFKTKNEAIRAALVGMAKEYSLLNDEDFLAAIKLRGLEARRKAGKLRTETLGEVRKRYGIK